MNLKNTKKLLILPLLLLVTSCGNDGAKNDTDQGEMDQNEMIGSQDFLTENSKADGVTTTASGLQYKVVSKGNSTEHPGPTDNVEVHYEGTLTDGTVFDSSYARSETISFPLNRVIAGWTEGLQLMSPRDIFMLYIPSNLAYGEKGAGGGKIGPNETLIFKVELFGFKPMAAKKDEASKEEKSEDKAE